MEANVEITNVQNIGIAVKFGETGDILHTLKIDCVLKPGDTDRVIQMFRERAKYGIPVIMAIKSPQARMDLAFTEIEEGEKPEKKKVKAPAAGQLPATTAAQVLTVIDDVEFILSEDAKEAGDIYGIRIGELVGKGDCPREAVLDVLIGQQVANTFQLDKDKDLTLVKQLAIYMQAIFPNTPALVRLLWVLENNTFEIPDDIGQPAKAKRKAKEPVSA